MILGIITKNQILNIGKEQDSFILEDLLCLCAEVLLFCLKTQTKKEMEEIKCQKNITFMSTDKGLKLASRYINSTGEKKNTKSI